MPTGANATNHSVHVNVTLAVLLISSIASRFGARAVMNIELVTQVAAIAVHIRYPPMRRDDGSFGLLSYRAGRLRITGYTVPPLRAVLDGVKGASSRSANAIAYPSVRVRLPMTLTSPSEI